MISETREGSSAATSTTPAVFRAKVSCRGPHSTLRALSIVTR
jgi:hypothetical protein